MNPVSLRLIPVSARSVKFSADPAPDEKQPLEVKELTSEELEQDLRKGVKSPWLGLLLMLGSAVAGMGLFVKDMKDFQKAGVKYQNNPGTQFNTRLVSSSSFRTLNSLSKTYPLMSENVKKQIQPALKASIDDYMTTLRNETAEAIPQKLVAQLVKAHPELSESSARYTEQLLQKLLTELDSKKDPRVTFSSSRQVLEDWVDAIKPDIGEERAQACKQAIDPIFKEGEKALQEYIKSSEQAGNAIPQCYLIMTGGLIAGLLASAWTLRKNQQQL